ncbi:MAG: Glycosyl transferase [Parcubacteria group bacterium Athens0714_24]|nr:MAG: Glycosyl transferase [Parcubacteria group bacterium Athens0714_24]
MIKGNRSKKILLVWGDLFFFYLSLIIVLIIRYFSLPSLTLLKDHFLPFTFIYLLWILVFYIAGFYDIDKKINWSILSITKAIVTGGIIAIFAFYFIPYFGITPKTNLAMNIIISSMLIWGWRLIFISFYIRATKIKMAVLSDSQEKFNLIEYIKNNSHFGYEIVEDINEAKIILVSEDIKKNSGLVKSLYNMILSGKTVFDFEKFYESLTGKVPVSIINETWFLENLAEINKQAMEKFKRFIDIVFAIILFIPLLIIYIPVALVIKINSHGPILFKQKRIGKGGEIFELVKFRSMCDRKEPPQKGWAKPEENDKRVTCVGNFIRKTRIDELPQIWNILKGDISLIGPRPERPEFVDELKEQVPYYSMRHIIKPGLTGWAQIHFSDASAKDAMEKLQYDLFYIKNRSMVLETAIFLKTIMVVLQTSGK